MRLLLRFVHGLLNELVYHGAHAFEAIADLSVCKAKDSQPQGVQVGRAILIPYLAFISEMLAAVKLDNQLCAAAKEINNVAAKGLLTPELERMIPQEIVPKFLFFSGEVLAVLLCIFLQVLLIVKLLFRHADSSRVDGVPIIPHPPLSINQSTPKAQKAPAPCRCGSLCDSISTRAQRHAAQSFSPESSRVEGMSCQMTPSTLPTIMSRVTAPTALLRLSLELLRLSPMRK